LQSTTESCRPPTKILLDIFTPSPPHTIPSHPISSIPRHPPLLLQYLYSIGMELSRTSVSNGSRKISLKIFIGASLYHVVINILRALQQGPVRVGSPPSYQQEKYSPSTYHPHTYITCTCIYQNPYRRRTEPLGENSIETHFLSASGQEQSKELRK